MSAAMDKIAGLLLEHPTAPLNLSITELAEQARTSAATVTRFCRAIGYARSGALRVGVRHGVDSRRAAQPGGGAFREGGRTARRSEQPRTAVGQRSANSPDIRSHDRARREHGFENRQW